MATKKKKITKAKKKATKPKKKTPIKESTEHRRESPEQIREEQLKGLIKQAEGGDTSAAKKILEKFCMGVREGEYRGDLKIHPMEISPTILQYLLQCFDRIIDQINEGDTPDANKALGLTASSRGRKHERDDVQREWDIWFSVSQKIAESKLPTKTAIIETAEESEEKHGRKLKWRSVETIYNKINRQIDQAK